MIRPRVEVPCAVIALILPAIAMGNDAHLLCHQSPTAAEARILEAQFDAGLYELPATAGNGPHVVPLTMHVVRMDDGSGGLPEERVAQAIADANAAFADSGISFCMPGPIDYIDSTAFYLEIDTTDEINALRSTNVVPNTINCYFTEILANENFGLCGISAFTSSTFQAIAMRNSCTATNTNHSTFPHEIGHFFDLYHTHETFFGEECVDGSNCDVAGDLLCDTPADPRLSGVVSEACQYIGDELDPCAGAPYDPQVANYMSYAPKPCRILFTPSQDDRALATLVNLRPELDNAACPGSADVNGDGVVNVEDLVAVILAWGECAAPCPEDINTDGVVDVQDLVAVVLNWT